MGLLSDKTLLSNIHFNKGLLIIIKAKLVLNIKLAAYLNYHRYCKTKLGKLDSLSINYDNEYRSILKHQPSDAEP